MISNRLECRVRDDFAPSEADTVVELLVALADELGYEESDPAGTERVLAGVVLLARGNSQRFLSLIALAEQDWRDVLMAADLARDDWPKRLTLGLGAS